MTNTESLTPIKAVDEYFDMLIKSRFIEMIEKQNQYTKVPLSDVINQYYVPEKIDHPEKETYITLSSYGKGIKKREIKEGKTPVPFVGCRIKEGQFVSSRLHAKEGAFGIVPRELTGSVVSRDFPVFDINNGLIDTNFLIASISQESFYSQFLNYSFGSTTKRRIKEDVFLDFQITLPPMDVQRQLTSFICLVQKSKAICKQIFESFDNLVKSRFIEMFEKCDKVPLTEMANITMGQSPDSSTYNDQGIGVPFFQGKAEFTDVFVQINKYCSEPKRMAKKMDILMSVRAPVGAVNLTDHECCIGRGLAAITPKKGITDVWFLFNALKIMEQQISDMGVGSTFTAISKGDMGKIKVPMAPIPLQHQFSDFVKQVDKSKFKVVQSLTKLLESTTSE